MLKRLLNSVKRRLHPGDFVEVGPGSWKEFLNEHAGQHLKSPPILTLVEITDNALLVETMIEDACWLLQINPYTTKTYAAFQAALDPSTGIRLLARLSNPEVNPLIQNESVIIAWVDAEDLPSNFRSDFMRFLIEVDQLDSHVASLSQGRWEQLRNWTNEHAH